MNNLLRLIVGFGLAGVILVAGVARASEKIATETGKACTACHDKPGSKLLTDSGKYYEAMKSLDGYDAVKESFGRCTACHDRKPGSKKLTRKGKDFAGLVMDMPGLAKWMNEGHPAPAAK